MTNQMEKEEREAVVQAQATIGAEEQQKQYQHVQSRLTKAVVAKNYGVWANTLQEQSLCEQLQSLGIYFNRM